MHAMFSITVMATEVVRLILTVVSIKLSQKSNISCYEYIVSFVINVKSKCTTPSCYVLTQTACPVVDSCKNKHFFFPPNLYRFQPLAASYSICTAASVLWVEPQDA
jgi:hypothetical protein